MSILIKGMEMPKTCADCRLTTWNGEDTVCPFSRVSALNIGRQVDCPLIEVPPHGRLIDADAFREDWLYNGANEYVYNTNSVLDSIDNEPTVIPADKDGET